MHTYINIYKREEGRELALTEKAKICSFIHQAGMTDTDKARFPVNKKQFFPKVTLQLSSIIAISSWRGYFLILCKTLFSISKIKDYQKLCCLKSRQYKCNTLLLPGGLNWLWHREAVMISNADGECHVRVSKLTFPHLW